MGGSYPWVELASGGEPDHIDIWAEVNDDFFLQIEDKTDTSEHSNQIECYREQAKKYRWTTVLPSEPGTLS